MEEEDAVKKIQALARGRADRRRVKQTEASRRKKERELAAARIQAIERGRQERALIQEAKAQKDAAVRIQAVHRGRTARRMVNAKKPGGVPLTYSAIKEGLSCLGRSPYTLQHAFLHLHIKDSNINNISAIGGYPHLQRVELPNNIVNDLRPLSRLPNLLHINFSGNDIDALLGYKAPQCGSINSFDGLSSGDAVPEPVYDNQARVINTSWTEGAANVGSLLQHADLSRNRIEQMQDVSHHRFLRNLYLQNNRIRSIKGLERNQNLQVLDLSSNKIVQITGLTGVPLLEDLRLNYNKIEVIEGLNKLLRLQRLYLNGNRIESLGGLKGCMSLVVLDCGSNRISYIRQVENLSALPYLATLVLRGNPIASMRHDQRRGWTPGTANSRSSQHHQHQHHQQGQQSGNGSSNNTSSQVPTAAALSGGQAVVDTDSIDRDEHDHNSGVSSQDTYAGGGGGSVGDGSGGNNDVRNANQPATFYRARVLVRLPNLSSLDDYLVSAQEKVKAINLHGGPESDVLNRQIVYERHFPDGGPYGEDFINHLPPLEELEPPLDDIEGVLKNEVEGRRKSLLEQSTSKVAKSFVSDFMGAASGEAHDIVDAARRESLKATQEFIASGLSSSLRHSQEQDEEDEKRDAAERAWRDDGPEDYEL